ncbi:Lon protease 2, peroxisomal [Chionoecetes opilio]|uniref:Lon protease 2, peroxisomal n=1 Tax=Chionoecetes opilio TaxID=41210 RepID=A0A8J5CZY0_CHIOP|nr:Lon protease 2, peroxisomal [Chionoecetes opilio]
MVVEASRTTGDSGLTLTGQLGSVMQESAKIALSWVRQHAYLLQLEKDFMKDEEIHMHFPSGAISKDGPSAGVTILTVLVSLLSHRCVRPDVAMTGEITLNGVVLPNEVEVVLVNTVGEVLLAAFEDGFPDIVPEDNHPLQSKL